MNILVINGPNINLLGIREKNIYGSLTYSDLVKKIENKAADFNFNVDFFQSNIEGEIINTIHSAYNIYDYIIINPAAYTHYSIAIYDAILAVNIPTIEVHISNIHKREEFRHKSVIASACIGQIAGFSEFSYLMALDYIHSLSF